MILVLLACRAQVDSEVILTEAEAGGIRHAPRQVEFQGIDENEAQNQPFQPGDITLENVKPEEIFYAPCPAFAPYDQVGAVYDWEATGLRYVGSTWSWGQELLGSSEYKGIQVWLVADDGRWSVDGGTYQFYWDRVRAYTCEQDGAHLVYEEGQELVVSHYSDSDEYFIEFENRPLVMPRVVEVDTSWTVEGVTWPDYPDGRIIKDDSVREHIGRGEETKTTGMGDLVTFRMKMMLSDSTYTYYWPMAGVGLVVDHNGLAINNFEMPQ